MTITELTREDLLEVLTGIFEGVDKSVAEFQTATEVINRWIERGDHVAVYENQDLGHHGLGNKQIVSFGSERAQLEVSQEDLPHRLPDIGGSINWRYQLVSVYVESETL